MITITARTTKDFFGEPLYIGELSKGFIAAALNIDRHELQFVHSKNVDETPEAIIELIIDAPGNEVIASIIESAFKGVLQSAKLTYSISFTGTIPEEEHTDTAAPLMDAVAAANADTTSMLGVHVVDDIERRHAEYYNYYGY